jgi:hypothetical protein
MTPSTGGWPVFLQGALLPLSNNPVGQFSYPGGTIPYQSPASGLSYWFGAAPALLAALSSQLVCGIAFALLPVSRRRAKVNWSHIIRVTSYGFALVIPAIMATMLSAGLTLGMNRGGGEWLVAIAAACWLALPIMLVIWWSTATSRYLRMPHAWGVGVSVVILGLLTPFTVVMVMMMYVIP